MIVLEHLSTLAVFIFMVADPMSNAVRCLTHNSLETGEHPLNKTMLRTKMNRRKRVRAVNDRFCILVLGICCRS